MLGVSAKESSSIMCMEVTFKCRLLSLSLLLALADFCLHVVVVLAWLLHPFICCLRLFCPRNHPIPSTLRTTDLNWTEDIFCLLSTHFDSHKTDIFLIVKLKKYISIETILKLIEIKWFKSTNPAQYMLFTKQKNLLTQISVVKLTTLSL